MPPDRRQARVDPGPEERHAAELLEGDHRPHAGEGQLHQFAAIEGLVRALIRLGRHVGADQRDCGHQNGQIIGEADAQDKVGDGVDRQHEITEGGEQDALDPHRRCAVESAIIGGHGILGEGHLCENPGKLWPEA